MARSQRGFQLRTRSRRSTAWSVGPNSSDQFITATGPTIWSNGVALSIEVEATIVRLRGYAEFTLEAVGSLGDGFSGAIGFGIVSQAAFAVGATAVPTPTTESEWPGWLYHRFFGARSVTATIADGANAVGAVHRIEIDSKAMRKIGIDELIMGVVEVTEQGTATMEMHGNTRMLLKLT